MKYRCKWIFTPCQISDFDLLECKATEVDKL
jgi:hypothetical protein